MNFQNDFFDKYIISFCLRNVTDVKRAIQEAHRILKPGGVFYCLEFSSPEMFIINSLYLSYKKNFIPWIGKKITNNKQAYKYLEESIDLFPNQEKLLKIIKENGFISTNYLNMFNGIVSVHMGYKL